MNTIVYDEKKTYFKYDDKRHACYLNETPAEFTPQANIEVGAAAADPTPVPGFAYTGSMEDGSTLIEATEPTYDEFISGLIRLEYSQSRVEAVQANRTAVLIDKKHEKAAEYTADWNAFQDYRAWCKSEAKRLLN